MINPVVFFKEEPKIEFESGGTGLNLNFFSSDTAVISEPNMAPPPLKEKPKKKPRTATKSETKTMPDGSEMVTAGGDLTMTQSNEEYLSTYEETNDLLKHSIAQIDMISGELKTDLDSIRNAKTLKGKYTYIPNLAGTLSSLMSTKITAIREINSSITNAHNLDLKRMKDLKMADANVDDDKYIMDMYNAFISTPNAAAPLGIPSMNDMTMGMGGMVRADVGTMDYNNYTGGLSSSALNAMRYETNSNIQTVVKFDNATGRRFFDVVNLQTGESVHGVERPDAMFLEDVIIDLSNNIARDTNLDRTYPLILIGHGMDQY